MKSGTKSFQPELASSIVLFLILIVSRTPYLESFRSAFVIAVQISGGSAIWSFVNHKQSNSIASKLGMGLAIGCGLSTVTQFCLRETPVDSISWLIPLAFLPLRFSDRQKKSDNLSPIYVQKDETKLIVISIFFLTLLAMSTVWWFLYPTVLCAIPLLVCVYKSSQDNSDQSGIKLRYCALIVMGAITSWKLSAVNDIWIFQSYDQVFSESLSWSILERGINDSPFAAGTPINYHWFVLLLSGIISRASYAESWTSITRVIPIISFIGIFSLTWELTRKLDARKFAPLFAGSFIIFYSNYLGLSIMRYFASPTFLFSSVWMLAFIVSAFAYFKNPSLRLVVLSSFLLFLTFGGKIMSGAIAASGYFCALLVSAAVTNRSTQRIRITAPLLFTFIPIALIFLIFNLNKQPGNLNKLTISNSLPSELQIVPASGDLLVFSGGNLIFLLTTSLPLAGVIINQLRKPTRQAHQAWFLTGSVISGIMLTLFTSHPGVSQLYFWLASVMVASAFTPLLAIPNSLLRKTIFYTPISATAGVILAFFGLQFWEISLTNETRLSFAIKFGTVLIGPTLMLAVILLARMIKKLDRQHSYLIISSAISFAMIFTNMGIGLVDQIEAAPTRISAPPSNPVDANLISGSIDQIEILHWLRNNTDPDDVIATNRFCIPGPQSCISKWQLVSALSHRRMLFEGGYFTIPNIPDQELKSRFRLSSEFALNPSPLGLIRLCEYGVKWYFFDHSVADPLKTWEPYSSVQIQNDGVSLLKLRCPTS